MQFHLVRYGVFAVRRSAPLLDFMLSVRNEKVQSGCNNSELGYLSVAAEFIRLVVVDLK